MQEFGGASSIALVLLALVAVGLFAPTWMREHNERQAQRNAVRLQQTIRALAYTAQVPEVVEVEASARGVRMQQRELRRARRIEAKTAREQARSDAKLRELEAARLLAETRAQTKEREAAAAEMADAIARREAAARARAAAARAAQREAEAQCAATTAAERWAGGASGSERAVARKLTGEVADARAAARAAKRRQRGRAAATGASLLGVLLAVAGLIVGATAVGVTLALGGIVLLGGGAWMLVRINAVWNAQRQARTPVRSEAVAPVAAAEPQPPAKVRDLVFFDLDEPRPEPVRNDNSWTPVPLPKPLYLSRATAAETPSTDPDGPGTGTPDQMDVDLAKLLHDEVERSKQALRDAHRDVVSLPTNAQHIQPITVADESKWSGVGDLDSLFATAGAGEFDDLDAVLRRRRAS